MSDKDGAEGGNNTDRETRRWDMGKRVGPIKSVSHCGLAHSLMTTRQTQLERSDPRAVVRSIDPESARHTRRRLSLSLSSASGREAETQASQVASLASSARQRDTVTRCYDGVREKWSCGMGHATTESCTAKDGRTRWHDDMIRKEVRGGGRVTCGTWVGHGGSASRPCRGNGGTGDHDHEL